MNKNNNRFVAGKTETNVKSKTEPPTLHSGPVNPLYIVHLSSRLLLIVVIVVPEACYGRHVVVVLALAGRLVPCIFAGVLLDVLCEYGEGRWLAKMPLLVFLAPQFPPFITYL